jgi:predicted phage terminase large subunit-like protein
LTISGPEPSPSDLLTLAAQDLACYGTLVWPEFELAAHVELLVSALEQVERGEVKRLLVSMPPRHGKSLLSSILFPSWYLGRHPDRAVIGASHSQELADAFGRKTRNLLLDDRHRAVFPACRMSEDSAAVSRFDTTAGGSYFGIGRGGGLTGRGGDLIVLDDPLRDAQEAASSAIRAQLKEWYSGVVYTRLAPGGAIVIVSTRWSQDDVAGWLLREHTDEGWKPIEMPAIAETSDGFRAEGDALWPSRFPIEALERIREQLGAQLWASLYQGRPAPLGGAIFKEQWFGSYREPPPSLRIVQAWDSAFKTATANDYSVCVTIGESKTGYHVLHVMRGKWEFPDLVRRMRDAAETWKPAAVVVEDAASGQSVTQVLKAETKLPVIGVKPQGSKILRAQLVAPMIESGKVLLPEAAAWKSALVDELASFPSGHYDDQVDALVHGLTYLRARPRAGEFKFIAVGPANATGRWRDY